MKIISVYNDIKSNLSSTSRSFERHVLWVCDFCATQEPLGPAAMMELHWKQDIYMDMDLFIF